MLEFGKMHDFDLAFDMVWEFEMERSLSSSHTTMSAVKLIIVTLP